MKLICTDLQAYVPRGVLYLFAYLATSVWKVWTLVMVSQRIVQHILADWSQNHHVLWGVNRMELSCTWLNVWNCRYVNYQYFSQNYMDCERLQCFDTVCWHQEEHPACKKLSDEVLAWYLSRARCKLFVYGPADATATPSSLASFKLLCRLIQVVMEKRLLSGCLSVLRQLFRTSSSTSGHLCFSICTAGVSEWNLK